MSRMPLGKLLVVVLNSGDAVSPLAVSPLLAYDSFSADGATATETADALGNTCPARNWTGANYANAGGKCSVAPTETVLMGGATANGNMETGDPPTGFTAGAGTILDSAADERTGGAGAASLDIARNGGNFPQAYQAFLTGISAGDWFFASGWAKRIDTNTAYQQLLSRLGATLLASIGSAGYGSTSWGQSVGVGRAVDNGVRYYCVAEASGKADGTHSRFDDLYLSKLTLATMMRTVDAEVSDFIAGIDLNVAGNSVQGMVGRLNSAASPTDFLLLSYTNGKVYLDSVAAGVYTPIKNWSVTYAAGRRLAWEVIGTTVIPYYNGVALDTAQTVPASTATLHGLFGSYNQSDFDNFAIYKAGSGLGF